MWWTADEACTHLGVRRKTLYTYVSRGWVRRRRSGGRTCTYLASDVRDLARRAAAARGHDAAAALAMAWGPPVLPSALTFVDPDGPYYRGVSAGWFVEHGTAFEAVVHHLWDHEVQHRPPSPVVQPASDLVDRLFTALSAADDDPSALLWAAACGIAPTADRHDAARRAPDLVGAVSAALGIEPTDAVRAALVWCLDHELNPSSFAARVASGAGATLGRSVLAGLATWSGTRHGLASVSLEQALDASEPLSAALAGFGHPLYPHGDPRGAWLVHAAGGWPDGVEPPADAAPSLDTGLVLLRRAQGWPRGAAAALFAVARTAGWVAHAVEQRALGPIRPRARYVGVEPTK
jgi:citrate synthase